MSDKAKGKAKEITGKVTGNDELEAEGRTQHAKGKVQEKAGELRDSAKGTAAAAKDALSDDEDDRR